MLETAVSNSESPNLVLWCFALPTTEVAGTQDFMSMVSLDNAQSPSEKSED